MLKRWNVYHGSENLGLKTAKEIREALRKGTLDPFDKVSAEGSNIREDLIEVDEIFNESADDEVEKQAEFGEAPLELPKAEAAAASAAVEVNTGEIRPIEMKAASGLDFTPSYAGGTNATSATNTAPGPAASNALPSSAWRNESSMRKPDDMPKDKDNKPNDKRYYLIDKSKILGPLSALEIQSLFNRNLLNQKVKVQKIGNTKSIPVAQFISSYSEDRLKELESDGKLNQKVSAPSSKVLNELARVANAQKLAKTKQNKTYFVMGGAVAVIGLVLFLIVGGRSGKHSEDREDRETAAETSGKRGSRPKLLQKNQQQQQSQPAPVAEDEGSDARAQARSTKKEKAKHPAKNEKQEALAEERARKKAEAKAKKAVAEKPAPAPAKVAKAPAPAPAASGKKESPITKAAANAGHVQTIGPLSYSVTALEACSSKCTLTMRDNTGATMKAIFFKTAYYDALKKSPNAVTLTGTTQKNGNELTILIQDVH